MSDYCGPCGQKHTLPVNELCPKRLVALSTKRATRAHPLVDANMATEVKAEVRGATNVATDGSLSAEEAQLKTEVDALEKKRRVAVLKKQRKLVEEELRALDVSEERGRSKSGHARRWHRRRRSSSSSSGSRTPSSERRRQRKWTLKHHTVERKQVKKLNPHELVEATCAWFQDSNAYNDLNACHAMLNHIGYISCKAKHNNFTNNAHIAYDAGVRKLAQKQGFQAFAVGNSDLSLRHYAYENIRDIKKSTVTKTGATNASNRLFTREGKKPCFAHNGEQGCSRDNSTCDYGHWCSRCGSRSHKRSKCRKD